MLKEHGEILARNILLRYKVKCPKADTQKTVPKADIFK